MSTTKSTAHTKVTSISRNLAAHEEAAIRAQDLSGLEVTEDYAPLQIKTFDNDYARVRTDRVIQPKGMPPASWGLL